MFKRFYTRVQILEETEEYIKLVSPSSHTNRFKFLVGLLLLLALFSGILWATAPSAGIELGIGMALPCLLPILLLALIEPWRSQVLLDAERRLIQFSPQYLLLARWSRHGKQTIPFSDVTEVKDTSTSELKLSTKDGHTIILRFDRLLEAALVAGRLTIWLYPLLSPNTINLSVMMQNYSAPSDDAFLVNLVKKVTTFFLLRSRIALDIGSYKIRESRFKKFQIVEELNVAVLGGIEKRKVFAIGKHIEEHYADLLLPGFEMVWAVRQGVIAEYDLMVLNIRICHLYTFRGSFFKTFVKPFVIASIPFGVPSVKKGQLYNAIFNVLGHRIVLIDDLLAATFGAELDFFDQTPHCVLLIGAGGCSIGVMKLGRIAHGKRIAYGGDWLDLAIQRHLYSTQAQWVSLYSCRQIKHAIGSLSESESDKRWQAEMWDIQGNSLTLPLTAADIKPALEKGLAPLLEELAWFFKTLPEEVMLTMRRDGILLAGGMAYLHGLDIWLANQLDMPVRIAAEPDLLVVRGLKKVLSEHNPWRWRWWQTRRA